MRLPRGLFASLGCALLVLSVPTNLQARRKPLKKIFPANPQSVSLENADADRAGYVAFNNQVEVDEAVLYGELSYIEEGQGLAVARSLPRNRRYARPSTVRFVETIAGEFYEQFGKQLVVDSAVRPADCQQRLRRHNRNAAAVSGDSGSSHERGTTVDFSRRMSKKQWHWLAYRLMYYRGLGKIRVIEERNCIHVFVRTNYERP